MTDEIHVTAPVDIHVAPRDDDPEPVTSPGWARSWKALAALAVVLMVATAFVGALTMYQSQGEDRAQIRTLTANQSISAEAMICRARYSGAVIGGMALKAIASDELLTAVAGMVEQPDGTFKTLAPEDRQAAIQVALIDGIRKRKQLQTAVQAQADYLKDPLLPCPFDTDTLPD